MNDQQKMIIKRHIKYIEAQIEEDRAGEKQLKDKLDRINNSIIAHLEKIQDLKEDLE